MTTGESDTVLYNCWVTCCTKYQVTSTYYCLFDIFIGQKCVANKTHVRETLPVLLLLYIKIEVLITHHGILCAPLRHVHVKILLFNNQNQVFHADGYLVVSRNCLLLVLGSTVFLCLLCPCELLVE